MLFNIYPLEEQEKFRLFAKLFYKEIDVCLLVYDMFNCKSFEDIKNYWIKEMEENCPKDISKKNNNRILI